MCLGAFLLMKGLMSRQSLLLSLLALSIVHGVGTTYLTIGLERLVERTITR